MKRCLHILVALFMVAAPIAAQQACDASALLAPRNHGTTLTTVDTRDNPGFDNPTNGTMPQGEIFQVMQDSEIRCIDGIYWYQIVSMMNFGWIPEKVGDEYVIESFTFTPEPPVPFDVPLNQPIITNLNLPLPTVAPVPNPPTLDVPFVSGWDWSAFLGDWYEQPTDPLAPQLPTEYAGNLPIPPVDLSNVHFVADANLNTDQLTLLAQNGFLVVPGTFPQFDTVYQGGGWDHTTGKAQFVSVDALLHSLFLTYQNALMFLEMEDFYGSVAIFLMGGYRAAEVQYQQALGTPLEAAARKAAIYYAVPLILIADGAEAYTRGYGSSDFGPGDVVALADPAIIADAQAIADLARAGEGLETVPILENYTEDFSQYKPRSYYAGNPLLEAYFRAMMWLGRITFLAKSPADTVTGLLVLRALQNSGAYADWQHVAETLDFLVGPVDDYGPKDYAPIAVNILGEGLPFNTLSNPNDVTAFLAAAAELPPPRVNSIPIGAGAMTQEELEESTRGFRLFGQRFTFDAYAMQQLIYPAVGTDSQSRTLPLGLDVPAVLGSDMAYALADEAGADEYAGYTDHVANLRTEINGISANDWLQNLYGGWLWTLQPMLTRDLVPPMMQTDAWKRRELSSMLGSYTELKHATLLYAEQPMGGLGGGGMEPPVVSYSYVEPNPLVFSRIAIVSALLHQGLSERGYLDAVENGGFSALMSVETALKQTASLSAQLAEMARKELAGEPLTYDELYFLQENFGRNLFYIRLGLEEWITNPPENTALVADIASNAASNEVLHIAIANPDLIYVITNSPYGLTLTRGAVYSYYEFITDLDSRMTDDQWRHLVEAGNMPPRPNWIDLYFSP